MAARAPGQTNNTSASSSGESTARLRQASSEGANDRSGAEDGAAPQAKPSGRKINGASLETYGPPSNRPWTNIATSEAAIAPTSQRGALRMR